MVLFLLLTFSLLATGFGLVVSRAAEVPRMTKEELKAQLGNPEFVILDVRTESDWKSSQYKIQGAVREVPGTVESWRDKYPKDKTLVLYCA
jgi:rhodanese-related sulfurtransferase